MKISLLSVAPPYRGGISEQTYHLYEQLKDDHTVNIINFKRQYPAFLFPGKTQYDKASLKHQDENYRIIDSINPISWRRAVRFIEETFPDLLLIRFWNPFFSFCHSYIINKVKKQLPDTKVICIPDNIIPHEKHFYDITLIKKIFKHVDAFVVMSSKVEEELKSIVNNPIYKKLFHPVASISQRYSKEEARDRLGITKKRVILFFGLIRKYKGLDILIQSNKFLRKELKDYQIIICGESYENKDKYNKLILENSREDEIKWVNKYIPEDLVPIYFSASDVVGLPYKSASQSGIIPMAYSYGRPVVASKIKGIQEMVQTEKTGFLFEKNNPQALSESIIDLFNSKDNYEENIMEFRKQFSWNYYIDEVLNLYKYL